MNLVWKIQKSLGNNTIFVVDLFQKLKGKKTNKRILIFNTLQ